MDDKPKRGGRRPGAGRPRNSGPYREPTAAVRVPKSLLPFIKNLLNQNIKEKSSPETSAFDGQPLRPAPQPQSLALTFYSSQVAAGLPSPADDYADEVIDFNQLLVKRPESTYCVRVSGDSMIDAGICPGDVLVIEQAEQARHGQIVIAAVNGEPTVKRYYVSAGRVRLVAENPSYAPIEVDATVSFQLWGVVTGLVRQFP